MGGTLLQPPLDESLATLGAALDGARLMTDPFPHFVLPNLFDDATAGNILRWLEEEAPWAVESRAFYLHHGCANLAALTAGGPAAAVAAPETLRLMRQHLARVFGVGLRADRSEVNAHRMLPGHRIGLHNDSPVRGTETHRLLINLNSGFDDAHGGHLVLLDPRAPEESAVIVRPLHNSAVAMEFSDRSWHCVDEIRAGKRYSIIYSFWRDQAHEDAAESVGAAPVESDGLPEAELRTMLPLLRECGAGETPHGDRRLIDHLQDTYRILRRWGCDRDVCGAGLFHGVLGTPGSPCALSGDHAASVRVVIGDRAFLLARLSGQADRRSLLRALSGDSLSESGEPVLLGRRDAHALAAVFWASVVARAARVPPAGEERAGLWELYEQTGRALPPRSCEDIDGMLAADETSPGGV